MQLRLLVGDGVGPLCDVVATIGQGHTIRDLSEALAAHLGLEGERRLVLPAGTPIIVDPAATVSGSAIVRGTRCLLVPAEGLTPGPPATPLRRLVVESGPDAGRWAALPIGRHVLGRAADVDISIHDDHLSRRHLALDVGPVDVTVVDLGSSNGSSVGATRVGDVPVRVTHRDVLAAGASLLRLRPPAPPAALPPTSEGRIPFRTRPRPGLQQATVQFEPGRLARRLRRGTDAPRSTTSGPGDPRGPRDLVDRARTLAPSLWERELADPDALDVRVGWTVGPDGLRPHVVSLGDGGLTVVCDDSDLRLGVLRWLTAQLATHCGPGTLAVEAPQGDAWTWTTWLPHAARDTAPSVRVVIDDGDGVVAGRQAEVRLVGRRGTQARGQAVGVTLRLDARSGTARCTDASGTVTLATVDGISEATALELALALAPIRSIDTGAQATAASLVDLLGGSPSATMIAQRWTGAHGAPIGLSEDGPVLIELAGQRPHIDVAGPREARVRAVCTVVAALAATHSPAALELVLLTAPGTPPHLADLPHVAWSLQNTEEPPARRLRAAIDRRADRSERSTPLVVVVDDLARSAHPGLDALVEELRSTPQRDIHLLASGNALVPHDTARRLEVGGPVDGTGALLTSDVDGAAPTSFCLATVDVDGPATPDHVLVHDVVRGRVVEDSRTSMEVEPPEAKSELAAIVDACRRAARDFGDRPSGARVVERTFMFSDVVRSTALVEAIGDQHWTTLVQWHDEALTGQVRAHDGEVVDHTGDGLFSAFPSPEKALRCAASIQRLLREHRETAGFAPDVRIGVHHAEVRYDGRYRGRGVHIAARIAAMAQAGEVLVSVATLDRVEGFAVGTERTAQLRGVSTPVPVASLGG